MKHHIKRNYFLMIGMIAVISLAACAQTTNKTNSPSQSASATFDPSIITTTEIKPLEPPKAELEFSDVSSRMFWQDKSVLGGDIYNQNFFERPFTTDMTYLPDLDILKAAISSDVNFIYFTISLSDVNAVSGDLQGNYGIEVDLDKDGRGDYSVWVANPASAVWTTTGVTILNDSNNDVGGMDPANSETGWQGDGYDTTIANSNPITAWARVSPTDSKVVQIAVYRNLIGEPMEFLWGAWADNGLKNPGQFDYDDFYTFKQAGSGYAESPYYSLKTVNSNDNTCRQAYGFEPKGKIPNLCLYTPVSVTTSGPQVNCAQFQPPCPAGCAVPVGGDGVCVPAP